MADVTPRTDSENELELTDAQLTLLDFLNFHDPLPAPGLQIRICMHFFILRISKRRTLHAAFEVSYDGR